MCRICLHFPTEVSYFGYLREETFDMTEPPTELQKGIAKDQLKRLKTGDLDLCHFQHHVDLSGVSLDHCLFLALYFLIVCMCCN